MSETEDIRAVAENNDFHRIVEEESGRSSSVDYLDTYEDIPKEAAKEYSEESTEEDTKEETEPATFIEHEKKPYEVEKKQATQPADTTTGNGTSTGVHDDDALPEERVGASCVADGRDSNGNAPVGEWNSLPVLVGRLRAALERSLATGSRRDDEPTPTVPEDSGIDSEEDLRIRSSMEQVLGNCDEPELRRDLKFLEDLLLSDIQTALSRLRETLERIDVAVLARNGAASDPTGKLHLLRLVSSLLSRLQVPEEPPQRIPVLPSTSLSRRRRGTRHTIGVSTEELALARKWLEEERSSLPLDDAVAGREQKEQPATPSVATAERKPEEVRDKCTKDAINQRQLLEDKNKEIRGNVYRGIQQVDPAEARQSGESNIYQTPYRGNNYQETQSDENVVEDNEERSRVSRLAAALRQRAELAVSGGGKYGAGNKFTAKKSKIKRANTIDIPSYLKLQAESLGRETTGCVSLRRPIHVGDRAFNSASVTVPALQPKTENDRKFLALITRNNEAPTVAPAAPFKALGFAKTMDMSSLTNEQWNSRFSNIKTTFDKPSASEDRENKPSSKSRLTRRFPGVFQAQVYGSPSERGPASGSSYNAPMMKTESTGGFRHAPSSPFRKIEKSSPVSPSKVPASYHWPKSAPVPTSTLREKARMMFDRESGQPPSRPGQDADGQEKSSFPRPPWIDQDRNEGKANGTVTENGRLDYRSFCKQFAPFVGKGSSAESKKLEEQRQRDLARRDRLPGVVDGKFSFKMVPDKRPQAHQYPPVERTQGKDRFRGETRNMLEAVKAGRDLESSRTGSYPDATLRGSSSVAVQTGMSDDHQDEGRSFRVAPKITKGPALVCSNASVQTSSDLEKPAMSVSDTGSGKQWKPLCYEQPDRSQVPGTIHPSDDRQRFAPDRDQNYRTVSSDSPESNDPSVSPSPRQVPGEQAHREAAPSQPAQTRQKQAENCPNEDREVQGYSSSPVAPSAPDYSEPDEPSDIPEQKVPDWPVERASFPDDDQNIQNQDISPDVGVVTRYTCAIATVASSVDSPEPRSEEVAMDSRASSSPSPSQWSWSKSRPPTNETAASEDEIRRHNLLQQSLVRRLQNEVTSLNDPPSNFGQHLTVSQSRSFNPPSSVPQSRQSTSPQPLSLNQSHRPSPNQAPSFAQSHQFTCGQSSSFAQIGHQSSLPQPANFDQPPGSHVSSRFAKFLAPVPQKKPDPPRAHSPGPVTANRVGALRDAYEQSPSAQTRPIHKERSPIPNGVTPIDSSDEYLVSCATKPSRSIVLSKSESWHQLAVSNSYPRAPRVNSLVAASSTSPASSTCHPKPPKPRSPSSQKLRSKQYEASSMADSVKKMEDKIRQYFDSPPEAVETRDHVKHQRRSPRGTGRGMVTLSRSRTMPGISEGERLRVLIPAPQQVPLLNVNTADVDKVFDDLFEEATRIDGHHC